MTMTAEYPTPNVFRLDPYYRDEIGRFVSPPATVPAPVQLLANGAVVVSADTEARNYWRVRCVRKGNGEWEVIYLEETSA